MNTKHKAILWPDHIIGKRESRQIREAHNALYNDYCELFGVLKTLAAECDGTPLGTTKAPRWGALCAAERVIRKAEGGE